MNFLKDEALAQLAKEWNVASFASFSPDSSGVRHAVLPESLVSDDTSLESLSTSLLSISGSVNVRTFADGLKSGPFVYGVEEVEDVRAIVGRNSEAGLYSIVNETIDVSDGGVSGVSLGGIAEFAPDATPRTVEAADNASLPIDVAERLLRIVYGPAVQLPADRGKRFEFSVHHRPVGYRRDHVLVWEIEDVKPVALEHTYDWPNRFSNLIGDKTFGLLLAHVLGAPVPLTTAVGRRVAPFTFGTETGASGAWLRTAPAVQTAGKYTTSPFWQDPFALLAEEDPDRVVAAVLSQAPVRAIYSGATAPLATSGEHVIEGVAGPGDAFMQGVQAPVELPCHVVEDVRNVLQYLGKWIRGLRAEWAHDGKMAWILQLHAGAIASSDGSMLSPGEASEWIHFDASRGIKDLRRLAAEFSGRGVGIVVAGEIGVTSHIGDILREAGIPAKLERGARH